MFLIHERKFHSTHGELLKKFTEYVKYLKDMPIVTDMESGIVRAIREQTNLKQIGCWRHLRLDVQKWLADNLPRVSRTVYINHLYEIRRSESKPACERLILEKKKKWVDEFRKHFEKNVEPKLEYFCVWSIDGKCPYDPLNGITTNISEGFNFLLKDFQSWQEVPLD